MPKIKHSQLQESNGIHAAISFTVPNLAGRNGLALVSTDVRKFIYQHDTEQIWMIKQVTPAPTYLLVNSAGAGGTDDQNASEVPFDSTGLNIAGAADVQAAIEALDALVGGGGTDDQTAAEVPFDDTGLTHFVGANVQAALAAADATVGAGGTDDQDATEVPFDDTGLNHFLGASVDAALTSADASITANASDITAAEATLASHTSSIAANAAAASAAQSTADTADGKADTNAANITTNTSNISTNTSNISTNTSNISANTTAITGKVSKSGDTMTGALAFSGNGAISLPTAAAAAPATGQLREDSGYLKRYDGTTWQVVAALKNKFDATVAPTVTDDSNSGYVIGSRWVDIGDNAYVCVDATVGAAIWVNASGIFVNTSSKPGSGEDNTQGYFVGALWVWIDAANNDYVHIYTCTDASTGAAVWFKTTNFARASAADPTAAGEDASAGYTQGDIVVNGNTKRIFMCADATDDAAVWHCISDPGIWLPFYYRFDPDGTNWMGPDGTTPALHDLAWTSTYGASSGDPTGNDGRHGIYVPFKGRIVAASFKIEMSGTTTPGTLKFAILRMRLTNQGAGTFLEDVACNASFSSVNFSQNIQKSTENGDFSLSGDAGQNVEEFDELVPVMAASESDTAWSVRGYIKVVRWQG